MDIGRQQNADPRWLLPLLCRRGHITRNEVGAIRIGPKETFFQIPRAISGKFADALQRTAGAEAGEDSVNIESSADGPRVEARANRKGGGGGKFHRKGNESGGGGYRGGNRDNQQHRGDGRGGIRSGHRGPPTTHDRRRDEKGGRGPTQAAHVHNVEEEHGSPSHAGSEKGSKSKEHLGKTGSSVDIRSSTAIAPTMRMKFVFGKQMGLLMTFMMHSRSQ